MTQAYMVKRDITKREQPWMDDDDVIEQGAIVYLYHGCTYGCIGDGVAVTRQPNVTPFFEVPFDSLTGPL